eukprot:4908849-Amphidinium_carterae.1
MAASDTARMARNLSLMSPVPATNLQHKRRVWGAGALKEAAVYTVLDCSDITQGMSMGEDASAQMAFLTLCELEGHERARTCLADGFANAALTSQVAGWHEGQGVR